MDATAEYDRKALVFLVGASDLRRIFQEWPDRMQLAVCLRADGECKMVVYREEEGARFLPRLRRALRLPPEDICFYPEVDGYPSRRLLYSEEKQLFALVQNAPEVVEEAKDYSLNFTYAMDEGIDPLAFLNAATDPKDNVRKRQAFAEPQKKPKPKVRQRLHLQLTETAQSEETRAETPLPSFMQGATNQGPGKAFQSVAQIQKQNPVPKTAVVHREKDGWIAIDFPGCLGGQVTISNPGRIFLRDDRRVVALHNDLIGREGNVLPERINLGVKFLPEGVKDILTRNTGDVQVSFENGFLFLATKRIPAAPKQQGSKRPSREGSVPWRFWASAAAILAIGAIGLQSALSPRSVSDADGTIDWSQFRSGSLDVINEQAAEPKYLAIHRLQG